MSNYKFNRKLIYAPNINDFKNTNTITKFIKWKRVIFDLNIIIRLGPGIYFDNNSDTAVPMGSDRMGSVTQAKGNFPTT